MFNIVIIQKYCDELNFYLNFTLLLVSFRMTTTSILNQLKKIKLFIKSVIKLTLNSFFFEIKAQLKYNYRKKNNFSSYSLKKALAVNLSVI